MKRRLGQRPSPRGRYASLGSGGRRAAASMAYFLQQLVNGIALGSIYGLIAIGYTMVYGIIGMINFAHGDIFMVSAFIALIAFLLIMSLGLPLAPPPSGSVLIIAIL